MALSTLSPLETIQVIPNNPAEHGILSPRTFMSKQPSNVPLEQAFEPVECNQPTTIPHGWTFHPRFLQSEPAVPSPNASVLSFSSKAIDNRGYFHHAEYRITTNLDIVNRPDLCLALEKDPHRSTDEFIELVALQQDTTYELDDEKKDYTLLQVDHFNRHFHRDVSDDQTNKASRLTSMYYEWIGLIGQHPESHLFLPSTNPKKYSCLGRKIAQQVVWDHQNGHITKLDVENAFSMAECTSLLSALQKRRVTDKQCQKIVRTVIQRFLQSKQFQQPQLESTFRASKEEGERGSIVIVAVLFAFVIWSGPMLSIPPAYFRRLREVAARADKGEYLPHLWNTLIKGLLKEWNDLNIVLALVLSANVGFLALPGTSEDTISALANVSRGAGIVSMFATLGGLLTSLSLIWLHQPMLGTGSSDACKYILGPAYKSNRREQLQGDEPESKRGSFLRQIWVATYLGMPLVLLVWSVIAFVISALTWTFLFSSYETRVTVVVLCAMVLTTPLVTLLVFWGPVASKDTLFGKMARGSS
ncbi:hypothetical protein RSOLAG1IB_04245 [Rhizoctonia solani AG-1 IB]|uniref:Uncharacterized protein n=1 Tax=Thanatephorus cucumeris (strain AG1-IB / isolate 7/3/14) TaxID=1108050 RepID=A0A0B7FSS6_THACB|nr:hypothetical protein RSOLAG1IB_04245 [Rhizoctonia solani AG-1 IB]